MLYGPWKNVADLEEHLSLDELQAIIVAARDVEHRRNKFLGLLKGIDIDEGVNNVEYEDVKRRVNARLSGQSEEKLELAEFGIDIE